MPSDVMRMREDAIRRAREMHAKSNQVPPRAPQVFRQEEPKISEEPRENQTKKGGENSPPNILDNFFEQDFFENFFKDKDRMLIIALLVILSKEEGNNSLLFALMYLLI